jgi:hypothetical protein
MELHYLFSGILIIVSVVGLFKTLYQFSETAKRSILEKMLKNKDITSETFSKYICE